jgi:hypothetical protein
MLKCKQLNIEKRCHKKALHHISAFHTIDSLQFFLFYNTLLTLLWSCVAWIPPTALISCLIKQISSGFWQTMHVQHSHLVNVSPSTALTAPWFQNSHMQTRFHHLLLLQCDCQIHCHLCGTTLKKRQCWSNVQHFVHIHDHLCKTCDSQA